MYTNAGQTYREKPYLNVPRKIIAEKYIAEQIINNGETKTDLPDYKFFCFNGKVKFFKIDFGRFVEHHANYYSPMVICCLLVRLLVNQIQIMWRTCLAIFQK